MKHTRFTLENSDRQRFSCVLNKAADYTAQWEQVFAIEKGYGFCVRCHTDSLDIYDYFAGETRATFRILSTEETDAPCTLCLQKLDK